MIYFWIILILAIIAIIVYTWTLIRITDGWILAVWGGWYYNMKKRISKFLNV